MKKAFLFLLTGISLSAIGQSSSMSSGPIRLQKGQVITMKTSTNSHMDMGMEMNNSSEMTEKIEVMDISEKGYRISKTLVKIKTKVEFMGQEMNFDSEKPDEADEELAKSMSDMIGKSEFGTLDPATGSYSPDKSDDEQGGNPFSGMMNSKDDYELGAVFLLPAGTKIGDNWKVTKTNVPGTKINLSYTLKSIDGNEANISFTSSMEMQKETEAQGMAMTMNMTGTSTGSMVVNIATGLVKSTSSNDDLEGNIEAMGQTTPVSGNSTTSVSYTH